MPFPILHTAAGYSISKLSKKDNNTWKVLIFCVFFANLPDFDFIPGLVLGKAVQYHRGASHSLMTLFSVTAFVGLLGFVLQRNARRMMLFAFLSMGSHILLDVCCGSVQLFWPFISEPVRSPVQMLTVGSAGAALNTVGGFQDFFTFMLSPVFLKPVFYELAVAFGIYSLIKAGQEIRRNIPLSQSRALIHGMQTLVFVAGFVLTA